MQVLEHLERMGDERFLALYERLAEQGFGPLDAQVAQVLKFRPQAIRKLPMAQRARRARRLLLSQSNVELTYELFGSYLMRTCKGLVTGFLDAAGVAHEDGMIEDPAAALPATERLGEIVAGLDGEFEPDDVTLYLAVCAEQWPEAQAIQDLWRTRLDAAHAG